jgi:transcriptional regulator with XRE-family HTH domain
MQRFGEKLRTLREQRGITQQQLADELGFSQVYLANLELGKKKPNVELLLKLSVLFGVSVDEMIKDDVKLSMGQGDVGRE